MNEILKKLLLPEDKFIPEMHLRQSKFTYSAWFICSAYHLKTKNKKRIQKIQRDLWYIYQKELDIACFQHDMVYGDFKDLSRRTASDKALGDKAFNIA